MGRRSKYTPQLVDALIGAIQNGATDGDACAAVGIDESTFYHWQKTKTDFFDRVQRARPAGWIDDLRLIRKAAREGDWRAAAEHLDRTRSPYRKSLHIAQTVTVEVRQAAEKVAADLGVPVDVVLAEAYRLAEDEPS